MTWPKVIIMSIIMGVYTAVMAMLSIAQDTSFSDLAVTFEVWILFGIFIIMNSKSAKDSALKCFVFFLISQPLVYLIQDIVNGSSLFVTYYRYWFIWTVLCLPMGFAGYYMKKDKWWGLIILTPILAFLGLHFSQYLSETMFSFPRHFLTTAFCAITLILYPIVIFRNKTIRLVGVIISGAIIIAGTIVVILNPLIYSTEILSSGDEYVFDDTYKVYLADDSYGDVSLEYFESVESWMVHADFKKAGETEFVLESPDGEKTTFNLRINRTNCSVEERKD